jgi:hypothetical protein
MPVGSGCSYTIAAAINHLYCLGSISRVLYITDVMREITADTMQSVNVPNRILASKPGEAPNRFGVDIVSATALYQGHDTWIKYGNYDLIVIDIHTNPLLGTPRQCKAMLTVLGIDTKVWMVGCGV